jgi:flagellar assembly factor FliW
MVKIQTKYLGGTDVAEEDIIRFPSGLPGFIDETAFILQDLPGNPVFRILQSVKTSRVAFIVTDPYHFFKHYSFKLDESLLESLSIKSEADIVVLTIVTLKDPFHASTINLKAPLIINAAAKRGKQYILNTDEYAAKTALSSTDSAM